MQAEVLAAELGLEILSFEEALREALPEQPVTVGGVTFDAWDALSTIHPNRWKACADEALDIYFTKVEGGYILDGDYLIWKRLCGEARKFASVEEYLASLTPDRVWAICWPKVDVKQVRERVDERGEAQAIIDYLSGVPELAPGEREVFTKSFRKKLWELVEASYE